MNINLTEMNTLTLFNKYYDLILSKV